MRTDVLDGFGWTMAFLDARVAGTADAQLADPTPCSDWDVASLLEHLTTVIPHYAALASGLSRAEAPPVAAATGVACRQVFPSLSSAALAAWSQPGALERTCRHAMGDMPGWQALSIHVSDLLLHGWDLSVATGQDDTLDPVVAELALAAMTDLLHLDDGRGRFFAPALAPEGSDAQRRLLAYAGRAWPPVGVGS